MENAANLINGVVDQINRVIPAPISIKPSLALVKLWQGIVEVVLRALAIVLGFSLLVAAGEVNTISRNLPANTFIYGFTTTEDPLFGTAISFTGYLIFVSLLVVLIEAAIIVARFLNIAIVNSYITIAHIVDICISSFFLLSLMLSGSFVIYAVEQLFVQPSPRLFPILPSIFATAVLCVLLMVETALLIFWMAVFIYMKWNILIVKQLTTDNSSDTQPREEAE